MSEADELEIPNPIRHREPGVFALPEFWTGAIATRELFDGPRAVGLLRRLRAMAEAGEPVTDSAEFHEWLARR